MLQNLREHAQGWIAGIIVAILCLAFALWGIQNYLESGDHGDTVAKVDGQKITRDQLNNAYQRVRLQQRLAGDKTPLTQAQQTELRHAILKQMVTMRALSDWAQQHGFTVSPEQLGATIQSMPMFQINGQFSPQRYQEIISRLLYSNQSFVNHLGQQIVTNQLQTGIGASAFVLPSELQRAETLIDQRRDIGYVLVPAEKFLSKAKVSDAEINAYYQQHQKDFTTVAKVKLAYLELSPAHVQANVRVSSANLKKYYRDNLGNYSTPATWQVEKVVVKLSVDASDKATAEAKTAIEKVQKQLQSGKSFAEVAKAHNNEKLMLSNDQKYPVLLQIAKGLKVGQLSAPFRSSDGYAIIKLLSHKPGTIKPYAKVANQVKQALLSQTAQKNFASKSDQLSELTYTNPNSLKVAAEKTGLPIRTTAFFPKSGGDTPLTKNPAIISAAFDDNVIVQSNNSDPIQLDDGTMIVLRAQSYQPAQVLPLAKVRDEIVTKLKQQAASHEAKQLADTLVKEINTGRLPEVAAKQHALTWRLRIKATRQQSNVPVTVREAAFKLPAPALKQSSTSVIATANGYAVVQLHGVYPGKFTGDVARQREALAKKLRTNNASWYFAQFVDGVKKSAKVSTSE